MNLWKQVECLNPFSHVMGFFLFFLLFHFGYSFAKLLQRENRTEDIRHPLLGHEVLIPSCKKDGVADPVLRHGSH